MPRAITQETLDDFVTAWSRLDRARPQTRTEVPTAVEALADWLRHAIELDELLVAILGLAYEQARSDRAEGQALVGLRHIWTLLEEHPLIELVMATPGRQALFWELYWSPFPALPRQQLDRRVPEQEEAFQRHLEGRAVRTPASDMTTFLLSLTHGARARIPIAMRGQVEPTA